MKKKLSLFAAVVLLLFTNGLFSQTYEDIFLEMYNELHDPANGYFSPEGAPYHCIETVMCEAPDQGHESTSEAYSFYIWLEAMYGKVTGDWGPLETAWQIMEQHIIPDETMSGYNPSSPATYASEWDLPSDYPSALDFNAPVGQDPVWNSLSGAYGNQIYGMHWLVDCDDFYEYAASNNGQKPVYINTFQRGPEESTWETIPHPSYETFQWGGPNGFLDLFIGDENYSQQWRFTNAPDADARVVQAMYWAREAGYNGSRIQDAARMGDWLRLSMFDKYFKEISVNTTPNSGGNGYNSCHYLLSWYYAWGGGIGSGWSWIIGCSHVHMGYQNPMAAYVLSSVSAFRPTASNAVTDWSTSLDRMIEFYQWLQAPQGPIGGGATNSWKGRYLSYPSGNGTFHGMCYDPNPVYHDPGSNTWPGFQAWSVERLCEYYYVTGDSSVRSVLDKWVDWLISEVTYSSNDFSIPARFSWSGSPDTWNGSPPSNNGLSVSTEEYGKDLGVASCFAKALIYYAAATGDQDAADTAKGLLDAIYSYRDDQGVCTPEDRADYERFYSQEVYVPGGWSGQMGNGDPVEPGATFISIRSNYLSDPMFQQYQSQLQSGQTPTLEYHRFWAQADFAIACLAYHDLIGGDPTPTTPPDGDLGDVNDDGSIDIIDALLIAQYYVGLDPAGFNVNNADTDCDGSVDIIDALLVAQFYVGLVSGFC